MIVTKTLAKHGIRNDIVSLSTKRDYRMPQFHLSSSFNHHHPSPPPILQLLQLTTVNQSVQSTTRIETKLTDRMLAAVGVNLSSLGPNTPGITPVSILPITITIRITYSSIRIAGNP